MRSLTTYGPFTGLPIQVAQADPGQVAEFREELAKCAISCDEDTAAATVRHLEQGFLNG